MVPQQQGNRMLAHGIDRLENCMELLEESNGNKRSSQASKDSLASRASFLAGSFFQSWLSWLSRLNTAQVSQGHSLTSYAGETWWQSGPNHSSWGSSWPAVGQTEGTWGVAKQTRLHWRNMLGTLVVSTTAGLLGQGLQASRSFQRKQGGTARWETLSGFKMLWKNILQQCC